MAMKKQVVLVWVALTAAIIWGEVLYSFDVGVHLASTVAVAALFGAAGTIIIAAALYALDSVVGRLLKSAIVRT